MKKITFKSLLWLIPVVYSYIAFLPSPRGIGINLDPSWKYAISRLAADNAIFGQDVIFTYGSLGYLVRGAVLEQNFLSIIIFRWTIYSILFGIALFKIVKNENNIHKALLAVSLLFPFLIADDYEALQTEYQILFIVILLLSSDKILRPSLIRWWGVALGAIAGFLLHTKVSLSPFTLLSILVFLSANLYPAFKSKSGLRLTCFAIIDCLLAAGSFALIFLGLSILLNFIKVIASLIISATVAGVIYIFYPLIGHQWSRGRIVINSKILSWIVFYLIYGIFLLILAIYSSPSFLYYLKGYNEITSGYFSGMSIVGSPWELGIALSEIALILVLLFQVAREGNLSFSAVIALVLWLGFKHGFVRQDGHVLRYFFVVPLILSLCTLKVQNVRFKKFSYLVHFYALLLTLISYNLYSYKAADDVLSRNIVRPLAPAVVAQKVSWIWDISQLKFTLNASSQELLNKVKLPQNALNLLQDKTVDIIPWEISYVPANHLNWQPRPIFQSYSAYTSFLDNINQHNLLSKPRDYILYSFSAIDGRHPFFDEPSTFFQVFCNYRLSSDIPQLIYTPASFRLMILEKRQSSICSSGIPRREFSLKWNESQVLDADDGFVIRAAVKFKYSLFGKIYKALFRVPPVMMQVAYMDGTTKDYRIIPENSNNGIIISHLPTKDSEALSFFQGKLPRRVNSFSFSTSNPLVFQPGIEINLTSYNLLDSSVKQLPWIDVSQLKAIKFLPSQTDGYMGHLDSHARKGDIISTSGWAVSKSGETDKNLVLITSGVNNKPLAIAQTDIPRPDVVKALNNSLYIKSGWSIDISTKRMEKGIQEIKPWIYNSTGNFAVPLNGTYRVEVR